MIEGGKDRYVDALAIAKNGVDPITLIVAAMLSGSDEAAPLQKAYPVMWEEVMLRRWQSVDGSLPGDEQTDLRTEVEQRGFLGRQD